jgi:N-acetyl-gamma-glutamyl-phosphate reductase/acetylglutamate kinase
MEKVFLIGKTGPIGQEFVRRLESHDALVQGYADLDWKESERAQINRALMDCAAVVTAAPRKISRDLVAEIAAINPDLVIYDCSGLHRGQAGWHYALPELNQDLTKGANRLVGPGCFATAASLALSPVRDHIDSGTTVFIEAIGGASTGGKKWLKFFEDNPDQDLCVPNSGLNHPHIAEIKANLDLPQMELRMVPRLARRYRGTTMAIHGKLSTSEELNYPKSVPAWERVIHRDQVPKWSEVLQTDNVHVHWVQEGPQFTIHVAYDNLGKGSVGQALQSLALVI